jgi:tetratricopeptide (TPR) repeat protein
MQFKCTHEPVDRIARQLEVGHIIEGSISAAGAEFRVSAQLIEAAGQRHIWADSFPGKLRDLFAIAKAIASHCAERLDLTTADAGLLQQRVVISAAYDHYLQARFHWFQLTRDAIDRALHHYEQALRHDPNFGAAYAGVSAVWQVRGDSGYVAPAEAYPYARDAASRALALSPDSAFVRGVYAYLRFEYEWDMEGALAEGERALALNGSDVNVHLLLWDCHVSARRFREAGEHIEACLKLDPYNPFFKCFYGWHLLFAERFEESVQPLRKAISDQPSLSAARLGLWGAFYRRGMHAQAIKEACEFFMSRGEPDVADTLAREYRRHEYRTAMRMAADELAAKAKREHVGALRVARLYSHANDANAALEWLLRALGERTPALKHLAVGWDWVCLRENAQFRRILAKVNLRIE